MSTAADLIDCWRLQATQWRAVEGICLAAGDRCGVVEAAARAAQLESCANELADLLRLVIGTVEPAQRN